jgi:L-ascorbate metabolism protein UlaG (beta-lactamase superfamily)
VRIRAVQAEHDGSRSPIGVTAQPLGYVVSGSKAIYFAGDTDLFDGMRELGAVDVGLIPIWGWGPTLGGGGHLDPARAAEAVARIRPAVVVPIHWGTYFPIHLGLTGKPRFVDLPPLEFVAALKEAAPDVAVSVLKPGEGLDL